MVGDLRSIRIQLGNEIVHVLVVHSDSSKVLNIERQPVAGSNEVNDGQPHQVSNGNFVIDVLVSEREVSNDQSALVHVFDDLLRDHSGGSYLVRTDDFELQGFQSSLD